MIKIMLTLLALYTTTIHAEDLKDLISKLGDDSYEVREYTSKILSSYPKEYIPTFLKLTEFFRSYDPEIERRLGFISYNIFINKVLPEDVRYKRLVGTLKIYTSNHFNDENGEFVGVSIDACDVDCPFIDRLENNDIIIEINDVPISDVYSFPINKEYGFFPEGEVCKLKIIRSDPNNEDPLKKQKIITVSVIPITETDERILNMSKIEELKELTWIEYLKEFRK